MSVATPSVLIVIPCLNEADHIGVLLERLAPSARRLGATVVVVDGGSTDDTPLIVGRLVCGNPRMMLIRNDRRVQAAAVNLAVRIYGRDHEYFIRIDAHGSYPEDYCDRLVEEALVTGADSVVVPMQTVGSGTVQAAAAAAQKSRLGTGGSRHRHDTAGEWIDHGHHALMRISAFRSVGGYDETFSHNEDAELDHRLTQAGYRIRLTGRTQMTYFPRSTFGTLYRQYLGYGRGRARNTLKHRIIPKLRQMVPLLVVPAAILSAFAFAHWLAAVPLLLWLGVCLGFGIRTAIRNGKPQLILASFSLMIIHFAWSLGFWTQLLSSAGAHIAGAPARREVVR